MFAAGLDCAVCFLDSFQWVGVFDDRLEFAAVDVAGECFQVSPVEDDDIGEFRQSARPGDRAPHVEVCRSGRRLSTHDLLGAHLTLRWARMGTHGWEQQPKQ